MGYRYGYGSKGKGPFPDAPPGIKKQSYNVKKMKKLTKLSMIITMIFLGGTMMAQIPGTNVPPRDDDHFQRWLVVNRIDLGEKINQPLVATQDGALYAEARYGETDGLVAALINGLKSGKYLAYDADSLNKSLTYEDVLQNAQRLTGGDDPDWPEEDFPIDDDFPMEDDSEFMFEDDGTEGYGFTDVATSGSTPDGVDVAPFETAIEFIENRIFDKNRSDIVHDIQYIRLVWVDPGETLPDKNFVCFKYADVLETLEDTQWKNKFNDAEARNLREVFEYRLFNSYVINVSGRGVRTLPESDFRSNQMLEYEHHLWSF